MRRALAFAMLAAVAGTAMADEDAKVTEAKALMVDRLDSRLAAETLDAWATRTFAQTLRLQWSVTECGEQTGDPKVERNRFIATCATLYGHAADGNLFALVIVGESLDGEALYLLSVIRGDDIVGLDLLGDLPAAIAP